LDFKIDGIANVIEKGFEARIAVVFGGLFGTFGEPGQKRQDLIRSDGLQVLVAKFV